MINTAIRTTILKINLISNSDDDLPDLSSLGYSGIMSISVGYAVTQLVCSLFPNS